MSNTMGFRGPTLIDKSYTWCRDVLLIHFSLRVHGNGEL